MNEQEQAKFRAANQTGREARNASEALAGRMAELIGDWFEQWIEQYAGGDVQQMERFLIRATAQQQIADIPRDQIMALALQAYRETNPYDRLFDEVLTDARLFDEANATLQQRLNDIQLDPARFDPLRQRLLNNVQQQLAAGPLVMISANRGTRIISNAILRGASVRETTEALEAEIGRSLRGAATLIARDGLYGYDGAVNDTIRAEYALDAFRYVGSIVEGSRAHCRRWVREQILTEEWLTPRIQALHLAGDPDGFRHQTTWDNFAQYRGGWNCRHQAIPVRRR